MKNLKKLVSVIVTVAMLISSLAALSVSAAYPDVDESNSYAKAIEVLSGLGIVKGDEAGNFNPTAQIKRSEMVALICRMKGEEAIATSTAQEFDDVPANHWAAGYISWGVGSEIIKGYGDGNFGPDAPVTLQDAVVMIVRAAGWERIANRSDYGGYPTGHLRIANLRGVMDNINFTVTNAATRDVVAQAVYNGMTLPLVEYTSYGEKVEDDAYGIFDGTAGKALKHLLSTINKIYKVNVNVSKTAKADTTLRSTIGDKVELTVGAGNYNYSYTLPTGLVNSGKITAYVGDSAVADYLGYDVDAYVAYDNELRDYKVLVVVPDDDTVTETIVASEVYSFNSYDGTTFKYFASSNATRATEVDFTGATVYYNGAAKTEGELQTAGFADLEDALLKAEELTFVGKKNADYDKVFIKDYIYAQVDEVRAADETIKLVSGSIDLSEETRGEAFTYAIYDAEGKAMEIADIAEDAVLNVVAPLNKTYGTIASDFEDVDYLDIYVSDEVVTGSVEEEVKTGTAFKIAGNTYKTVKAEGSLDAGYAGTFYLTIDGRIFAYDATTALSKNFAFIVAASTKAGDFNTVENKIKLFTADGKLATYDVANSLRVYNNPKNAAEEKYTKASEVGAFIAYLNNSASYLKDSTVSEADVASATYANRLVTINTNSDGAISEIRFAGSSADDEIKVASDWTDDSNDYKYNGDTQVFAKKELTDSSVLFVIPATEVTSGKYNVDEDKLSIGSFSAMNKDDDYFGAIYTFKDTEHNDLAAAVVAEDVASEIKLTHLAVVKSVGEVLDAEENKVDNITFVQGGEVLSLSVDNDETALDDLLGVNDIFRYTVNEAGEIDAIELVWDHSTTTFDNQSYTVASDDIEIVKGTITAISNGKLTLDGGDARRLNETEGNTYAAIDYRTTANAENRVSILSSALSLKETYEGSKVVYELIAIVNEDDRFEDCVMIIKDAPAVSSVTLNETTKSLAADSTFGLVATVNPTYTPNKAVTWSVQAGGDADITVDDNGVVTVKDTATSGDTATIVAESKADSTKKATCVITVS